MGHIIPQEYYHGLISVLRSFSCAYKVLEILRFGVTRSVYVR